MVILVVDDEPGIRLLLKDILSNEGYTIITAKTGKEALDQIQSHSIDLMMLDYKLPIMDGVEVIKQLDNEYPIPTIIMSGLIENVAKETDNLPQVTGLLEKPFDIQQMVAMVQSTLIKSKSN